MNGSNTSNRTMLVAFLLSTAIATGARASGDGDFFDDGYVDNADYSVFAICLSISGPDADLAIADCLAAFDFDNDSDIDVADFAAFQRAAQKHSPIPLKDSLGNVLTVDSTIPYSGRQTCGTTNCHDLDTLNGGIMNGQKFQQGRTDTAGNVVMKDDYFGDGRWWMRSPGRFGVWSQATTLQMAGKENANESVFDQSAFAWIRDCSGCHPGGGPGEFDRDGELLYNEVTGQFGYEALNKTAADVLLDGDYADFDYSTSAVVPARWDLSGLSGPDCLFCHRNEPPNLRYREAALGAAGDMRDNSGQPVPGFAAAATAGQEWVSNIEITQDEFVPRAYTMQIDYSKGVDQGILMESAGGTLSINGAGLVRTPNDRACWVCHSQKELLNGMVWFDDTPDIHYRKLNNLSDDNPYNDISGDQSKACTFCHPGGLDHNFAKGNDILFTSRDETDWAGIKTCRRCHLTDSPDRHPDAPPIELGIDSIHTSPMFDILSCQACHIPHALSFALMYFDSTHGGNNWPTLCCAGLTFQYYSADPVDPTNDDKSRWYPAMLFKKDEDGVDRVFPFIAMPNTHWADWEENDPGDPSDDLLTPILQWRMHEVIGSEPLPVATDDNGDTLVEINRPAEILAYINALKGYDSYGRQVAARPVLVKGPKVWYEDFDTPDPNDVNFFEHEGTGIPVNWYYYIWGLDHNVLPKEEAWGYDDIFVENDGCDDCHRADGQSPVFDRVILVDPWSEDENATPAYRTVREMTGLHPELFGPGI